MSTARRLYALYAICDFPGNPAQANINDLAWSDLDAHMELMLDPVLAAGVRNVIFFWCFGYTDTPYSAGASINGDPALISPYNQINHAAATGDSRAFLDQIAPAFASRAHLIDHLVFYCGPLHASSGTSNAELDALTEIAEACGADQCYDAQSAIDFTVTPPHRLAVVRYHSRTGRKIGAEPWRGTGVNDAKAAGWDPYTSFYVTQMGYAASSQGNAQSIETILGAGRRSIIEADGSSSYAEMLAGLTTWMAQRHDFACDFAALTAPQRSAIVAAAVPYTQADSGFEAQCFGHTHRRLIARR